MPTNFYEIILIRFFVLQVLSMVNAYEWLPKEHLNYFDNKIRHLDKHVKVNTYFRNIFARVSCT